MIERLQHFGEEFVACDHHFWVTLWLDSNLLRKISEPPTFCRASSVNNFLRGWSRRKIQNSSSRHFFFFLALFAFCLFTQLIGKLRAMQRLWKNVDKLQSWAALEYFVKIGFSFSIARTSISILTLVKWMSCLESRRDFVKSFMHP